MKSIRKLLSILIIFALLFAMPVSVLASSKTTSPYTGSTYTHQTKQDGKKIYNGIDVSEHNSDINWAKVAKKASFAIIRVGYRGYNISGKMLKDECFDTNIKKARENGVKVGIYFYSQAVTTTEAIEEAKNTLKWLGDNELDLPIFYDYEFADVSSGRLDSAWRNGTVNRTKMTNNAIAFMDTINDAGYTAMIYANRSFLSDHVDYTQIEKAGYGIWVAEYDSSTSFKGDYVAWQYSDSGKIDGISGRIDSNFWYGDLSVSHERFVVEDIPSQAYTGSKIKPSVTVKYDDKVLKAGKDYYITYKNNVDMGYATATVVGIDDYEDFARVSREFKIVPPKVKNLTVTDFSTGSISVKWTKSVYATEYNVYVYRSGDWKLYKSTTKGEMTITDLKPATNYSIRVAGCKNIDDTKFVGKFSDEAKCTTGVARVSDTSYTSTDTSVTLSWKAQENATGYQIQRYSSSTGKYALVKTVEGGKINTATITGLKPSTLYRYRIRAYKVNCEGVTVYGAYCDRFGARTKPTPTTLNSLSTPSSKTIKASWTATSGISGYQVQWSTYSDFLANYKSVSVSSTNTSTKITTAQSGAKYYVRVRTYKTIDGKKYYSKWSNTKSVTTK